MAVGGESGALGLRCINCFGPLALTAAFCGSCGISRDAALGAAPIPPGRRIGSQHELYRENQRQAAEGTTETSRSQVPQQTGATSQAPVVDSSITPSESVAPRERRTLSLEEVEAELREEQARVAAERAAREQQRLEAERIAREEAEKQRQALLERQREAEVQRLKHVAEQQRMREERAKLAKEAALRKKDKRLRRLLPVGVALSVIGLLGIAYVLIQASLFASNTPNKVVEDYATAVAARDVTAITTRPDLFPIDSSNIPVLPSKFQQWGAAKKREWSVDMQWNNWTGNGTGTLLVNGSRVPFTLTSTSSTTRGIFRNREWRIQSTPARVRISASGLATGAQLELNGVKLGGPESASAKEVLNKEFWALPGSLSLAVGRYGFSSPASKTISIGSTGVIELALPKPPLTVSSVASQSASRAALKRARSCARSECGDLPYFSDSDFYITAPTYYEYVRWERDSFSIKGCTTGTSTAISPTEGQIQVTCTVNASRYKRWVTLELWNYYYYSEDRGTASDTMTATVRVRINPANDRVTVTGVNF